jgi:hypothetical protein
VLQTGRGDPTDGPAALIHSYFGKAACTGRARVALLSLTQMGSTPSSPLAAVIRAIDMKAHDHLAPDARARLRMLSQLGTAALPRGCDAHGNRPAVEGVVPLPGNVPAIDGPDLVLGATSESLRGAGSRILPTLVAEVPTGQRVTRPPPWLLEKRLPLSPPKWKGIRRIGSGDFLRLWRRWSQNGRTSILAGLRYAGHALMSPHLSDSHVL